MREVTAFLSGVLFGLGLIVAGMNDPLKVLAFLDLGGYWDPSLAFVMVGGIATAAVGFARAKKRPVTWTGETFVLPLPRRVDAPLVVGSLVFGVGWGMSGFCPGPGLVGLGAGYLPAGVFALAMFFGIEAYAWYCETSRSAVGNSGTEDWG